MLCFTGSSGTQVLPSVIHDIHGCLGMTMETAVPEEAWRATHGGFLWARLGSGKIKPSLFIVLNLSIRKAPPRLMTDLVDDMVPQ